MKNPSRKRRVLLSLTVAGTAAAGLSIVASGAYFTGSDTVGGNQFTTGTVVLGAAPVGGAFAVSNMAPGDVAYKGITVSNTGSLELRYTTTSAVVTGDAVLAAALDREVKKVPGTTCDAATFSASTDVVSASAKVNASAVAGNRVLAAGANETLCFKVTLPTSADNTVAAKSLSNVTLTFDSVQTKNNP